MKNNILLILLLLLLTIGCTNKDLINDTVWILKDCLTITNEKCYKCSDEFILYFRADGFYKKMGTDIYWCLGDSGHIESSASIGRPFGFFEGTWEQINKKTIVSTAKCTGWPYKVIEDSLENNPIFDPYGRIFVDTFSIVHNRKEKKTYISYKDSVFVKFDKFKKSYLNFIIKEPEGFDK